MWDYEFKEIKQSSFENLNWTFLFFIMCSTKSFHNSIWLLRTIYELSKAMPGGGPTLSNSQENTWISVLFFFTFFQESKEYL